MNRRLPPLRVLLVLLVCGSAAAAARGLEKHHYSQAHLGTGVHLVFYTGDQTVAGKAAADCFRRVRELDAVFSDYRADSEVRRLCAKEVGKPHRVSPELFAVLRQAREISVLTGGAFDVTLGEHTRRWRKHENPVRDDISYRDLDLDQERRTVTLRRRLRIDLGGIAKGYIADQLMLVLRKAGIVRAAVVIGGETVLADAPPGKKGWKIGVENPAHEIIGTLELANTALSTSGDSYQFFETDGKRRSHLIDPATKESKTNRLNVTTIAPTAMQADAWATALRILPAAKAMAAANRRSALEALFIPHRERPRPTQNFPPLTPAEPPGS